MLQTQDYPTVLVGLFLEQPTPFIREFFQHIAALNYPKNKIDMYIHNKVRSDEIIVHKSKYSFRTHQRRTQFVNQNNKIGSL